MSTWRIAAIAALGMALSQAASADPVIYTQAWDGNAGMLASQNDVGGGNGNFATYYDDFSFTSAQRVTDVHWTGGFFNPATVGSIDSFSLNFYADNGGSPGASVYSATVNAAATSLGDVSGFPMFTYDVDLPLEFLADANTKYWISIVANMTFPPQWGVALSNDGNGVSVQDFFGTRSGLNLDMAFSLTGTAQVPEPGSLPLVALAVLGMVAAGRRAAQR